MLWVTKYYNYTLYNSVQYMRHVNYVNVSIVFIKPKQNLTYEIYNIFLIYIVWEVNPLFIHTFLRSGEQGNIFEMEMFSDHTVIQCSLPKEFERQVKASRSGGDYSRYHWVIAFSPQRYKLDDKTYRPAVNASLYQQTRTHTDTVHS